GGVDARYKFNDQFYLSGEVQHQTVLASDAKCLLVSTDVRMQRGIYNAGAGVRHVADEDASGDERVSDQAFVTASVDLFEGMFTLRGTADTTLGGHDASVDYPSRSVIGLDYRLSGDT